MPTPTLPRTTGHRDLILDELDRIMAVWPNRQSLILAVGGMTPHWGGPPGWGPIACGAYADRIMDVPGYTPEICKIDILFAAPYPLRAREQAFGRLANHDNPVLDDARYEYAVSMLVPDTEEAIAGLKAFQDKGLLGLRGAERLDALSGTRPDEIGPATRRVIETRMPKLRAAVDFDPADNHALTRYMHALALEARIGDSRVQPGEIAARYSARFTLARYDGDTWDSYGHLMEGTIDFDTLTLDDIARIRGYFQNGAFYSNHGVTSLFFLDGYNQWVWQRLDRRNIDAMDTTGEAAFAKADFDAAVICPTVRAIRVLEAVCASASGEDGCGHPGDPSDPRPGLIARAEKRRACTVELGAPVRTMASLLVCSLTGLAILVTGVWQDPIINCSPQGATLTAKAFNSSMPGIGNYLLLICAFFFAITSLFSYSYYGNKALSFLIGVKRAKYYDYFYLSTIVLGAILSMRDVMNIIDIAYALMALPTMLSGFALAPKVLAEAKSYFSRMKAEGKL